VTTRSLGLRHKGAEHLQIAQDNTERALREISSMKRTGTTAMKVFAALAMSEAASVHLKHAHDLLSRSEAEDA
jgi:hypothetical protein